MRILIVSDVHCSTGNLGSMINSESYDLVLAAGDFECVDSLGPLEEAPAPVLAVTGNMDHAGVYRRLVELGFSVEGGVREVEGLRVAGVGGLDYRTSMERLKASISGEGVDVLLSHHPPKGILDSPFRGLHAGLKDMLDLVERLRPRLHVFGHIHEARGYVTRHGTTYINPGPALKGYYSVAELGEGGNIRVEMLRL